MVAAAAAAPKNDEGSWWSKTWGKASEWVHGGLDVLGFIPGFGEIADGANALIYLAEGRHLEAAISAAAMIPIVGDAGKLGKWGVKAGKEIVEEVVEEGAERVVKEVAEEVVEEGAERAAKQVPEALANRTYREVEIVDAKGSPLGEFDKIDNGIIVEEKAAQGLDRVNPRTGLPAQTADQWAEKQIYKKTQVRIDNLDEAVSSRPTVNGSPDVPSLEDIKTIRDIRFHLNGDSPELRSAVQKQMDALKQRYPDWNFDAEYGL
ncbi:hypothetical protein SE18_01435 [Herpetosiphon geysericola]|uniref:Pre-toxin TG domain-containing protein n=2 Tax=Herpetosiphon geysericola TaxID=70996 RepID=A0A0P6Y236_9CHLR|nr:hypothetical protein SE18_01435 [Herpetosiphon geysericola]